MFFYEDGRFASMEPLPLREAAHAAGKPVFLLRRSPETCRASFRATDARQLVAEAEDVSFLDPRRLPPAPSELEGLAAGMRAVNFSHPRWRELADQTPKAGKLRVHILAMGDVGSTILMGLKLLGGDVISKIGICDLSENALRRWEFEMNQVTAPWDYDAMPEVEIVPQEQIFACDCLLFAASRGIPPVDSQVKDVRMAQFEANRGLVEHYGRLARQAGFRGLFAVISDPVDPLAKAAFLASNVGEDGVFDGLGLLPEQIQGFGLGVMNARAAYYAKNDPRFSLFLTEGRAFGPHGSGLVIANSIRHYDDALSRELTELALHANLRMRELGFKPYVAPALSSAAVNVLLALRGAWHYSSVFLGGIFLGVRNRLTAEGVETETLALPDALWARLRETERGLREIL
ncbi:MAG: lactate dehydrogenase [Oscillospiraceae bacterium]|nr:lactate dehydrogenase [Oscillospiraceae bacterium]